MKEQNGCLEEVSKSSVLFFKDIFCKKAIFFHYQRECRVFVLTGRCLNSW